MWQLVSQYTLEFCEIFKLFCGPKFTVVSLNSLDLHDSVVHKLQLRGLELNVNSKEAWQEQDIALMYCSITSMSDVITMLGIPFEKSILKERIATYRDPWEVQKLQEDAERSALLEKHKQKTDPRRVRTRAQAEQQAKQELTEELANAFTVHGFVLFWLQQGDSDLQRAINLSIMAHLQVFTVFDQKRDASISPHEGI